MATVFAVTKIIAKCPVATVARFAILTPVRFIRCPDLMPRSGRWPQSWSVCVGHQARMLGQLIAEKLNMTRSERPLHVPIGLTASHVTHVFSKTKQEVKMPNV